MRDNYYTPTHSRRFKLTARIIGAGNYRRVLDIGAYEGEFARHLLDLNLQARIILVDIAMPKRPIPEGTHFVRISDLNLGSLPFLDDSFNLVTCLDVLEHLAYPDSLIQEVWRVLTPGGEFVITTPNLSSWANRLSILLGFMPISQSISIGSEETGKRDILRSSPKPKRQAFFDYHVRCYTRSGLKVILELGGFRPDLVTAFYGYRSKNKLAAAFNRFTEWLIPSMSQVIIVKATAIKPGPSQPLE